MEPPKKNNVKTLPGVSAPNINKDTIEKVRADMPFILEMLTINASMTRHKFQALRKEGFTAPEALELCRAKLL